MEEKLIEVLYKIIIDGLDITQKTMQQYGLSDDEISLLVETRVIMLRKDNKYILFSVDKFRKYGVTLLLKQKIKEANICFEKCYEMAPKGRNIALQYLLANITHYNYQKAFETFANLETIQPEKNKENNNLYLYLLSIVAPCQEEYKERVRNMDRNDIMLPYSHSNKKENQVRDAILKSKFTYAYQIINSMISRDNQYSIKFELIRVLLIQAIEKEKEFKSNLLYLAKNKQYNEIFNILTNRQKQRCLSKLETYILLITDAIIKLINNGIIPKTTSKITYDMFEALVDNNYHLALELNEQYLLLQQKGTNEDVVNILLTDIINFIKENQSKKECIQTEDTKDEIEELAYYITSNYKSLDEAIKQLGLMREQVHLIKLVYARDYYIEGMYLQGDLLIKEIETSKDKTYTVMKFLEEIKTNKLTYKNHTKKRSKTLS